MLWPVGCQRGYVYTPVLSFSSSCSLNQPILNHNELQLDNIQPGEFDLTWAEPVLVSYKKKSG